MRPERYRILAAAVAILFSFVTTYGYETDDTLPEVTDRVARITVISGDVQVRRSGSEDWENADANLPVVEGDEVATGRNSRMEIQFSNTAFLRLDSDSVLSIRTLADEGIALSLGSGSAILQLRKFDPEKEYFEIDAPESTVAALDRGSYRIDAGSETERSVRVTVTDGGEARVYSTSSGFTLKSGRTAKVFLDGDYAGEWETADAGTIADDFAAWTDSREREINDRLNNAYYDKYYDSDMYGAEDLNGLGDWEYTRDYGYVWQPYQSTIGSYADWSPYRYGSWRWVPPFGWTWVNDEPWGWATYHHGRWLWYRDRWVWTPYSHYRSNRSWWYPALVVIRVINRNVCWYPLSYGQNYYDYNYGYHDWLGNRDRRRRRDNDDRRPRGGNAGTTPAPTPPTRAPIPRPIGKVAPNPDIPEKGIVMLPEDDFGTGRKRPARPSIEITKGILAKRELDPVATVKLPSYEAVRPKLGREILVETKDRPTKGILVRNTGAAERKPDTPLDRELKDSRFYGNRQPVPPTRRNETPNPAPGFERSIPRDTGAVKRQPLPKREVEPPRSDKKIADPGILVPRVEPRPRKEVPVPRQDIPKTDPTPRKEIPRFEPPARKEIPPPRQEQPKYEPPVKREPPPRQEQPKYEPPVRREPPPRQEQPKSEPPVKREPPPAKNTPPPSKPNIERPSPGNRKKDN